MSVEDEELEGVERAVYNYLNENEPIDEYAFPVHIHIHQEIPLHSVHRVITSLLMKGMIYRSDDGFRAV